MHSNLKVPAWLFIVLLSATLVACGTATTQNPEGDAPTQVPSLESDVPTEESAPTSESATESTSELVIATDDPCGLVTEEQVAVAFGKSVVEVEAQEEYLGSGCEYAFEQDDTALKVTFYEGEAARYYFASLILAGGESCDAFFEALFDAAFAPLQDDELDPGVQAQAENPLPDLYRAYLDTLGECMYVHWEDRPELGEQVVVSEVIFANWSSNVAMLAEDRVVEVSYEEPLSAEAQAEFQGGTDRDSYYAIAEPYRNQVLVAYSDALIALLQQASE